MDLESANGTTLNGDRLAPARFVELKLSDVLRFGGSSREYVLLHDKAV
jgi:smad nuclear-interacting protein 1